MRDLLQELKALRHRLRHPNGWCKHNYRSNTRVCLVGGMGAVLNKPAESIANCDPLFHAIHKELPKKWQDVSGVVSFNDESTHKDVLKVIDKAIARQTKLLRKFLRGGKRK